MIEQFKTRFHKIGFDIYYLPYPKVCKNYTQFKRFYKLFFERSMDISDLGKLKNNEYSIYSIVVWDTNEAASVSYIVNEIGDIDSDKISEFSENLYKIVSENNFVCKGRNLAQNINNSSEYDFYSFLFSTDEDAEKRFRKSLLTSVTELNYSNSDSHILSGELFGRHIDITKDISSPKQYENTTDAPMLDVHYNIFSGNTINYEYLINSFLNAVIKSQRKGFKNNKTGLFQTTVIEQYALLCALSESDLLQTNFSQRFILKQSKNNMMAKNNSRDVQLKEFIKNHPPIDDNPELRSIFVLGGLIGRISQYQNRDNVSATLDSKYPIDSITKSNIKRIAYAAIEKNRMYSQRDSYQGMNSRYTEELLDSMLLSDKDSVSLSVTDIRWIYALGLTYGYQDTSSNTNEEENKGDKNE